jgi:hypothetical protein
MTQGQVDRIVTELAAAPESIRKAVLAKMRELHPIHEIERQWQVPAEVILEAISRSSDLSQRGVRGLIAEAYFELDVIPQLAGGWAWVEDSTDENFDFLLRKDNKTVRIEVKQQRREKGKPSRYRRTNFYKVETQRTRTGTKAGQKTRPYRTADFDILAVNMRAATGDWGQFRFASVKSLLTKDATPDQLETMQPVSLEVDKAWSDDINVALQRWEDGQVQKVRRTQDE